MAACFRRTGAAHSREPQHATPHKVDAIFRLASSARVARRGLFSNEHVDRALCRLKRLFVDVLKGGD